MKTILILCLQSLLWKYFLNFDLKMFHFDSCLTKPFY
ncbi:hypothetical protein A0H76_3016 [Hepatospora eriocheir]|uniref:Uncharacterized protein n=1 Tax=Hepatospora eriocheir TaxID=1081669 RepID=A0A1X0QIT4_9MICR|nr:hypothetical protein A0H76_3016 [Hepatospora eriocheir]